jgi:hypothetical protein
MKNFNYLNVLAFSLTFIFQNILSAQSEKSIFIIDTIRFEGVMVLDQIKDEIYFVEKNEIPEIKLKYNSYKEIDKILRKVDKKWFLNPHKFTKMLEQEGVSCNNEIEFMFSPYTDGIAVWESNQEKVYFALLSKLIVKSQIKKSKLDHYYDPKYLTQQSKESIFVYSFLNCAD